MKFASILVFSIAIPLFMFQASFKQQNYDHMEFVMTWVPTFCALPTSQCKSPMPQVFTLHGLWPGDSTGDTLKCKDKDPGRNLDALFKSLSPELEDAWPSVTNLGDKYLWLGEYSKHGCCAEPTVDTLLYFTEAIQKRKDIKLLESFVAASILPSDHIVYTKTSITTAVRAAIGQNIDIYLSCKDFNTTHISLYEVYVCLDRTLTHIVSCPYNKRPRGCYSNVDILLPLAAPK